MTSVLPSISPISEVEELEAEIRKVGSQLGLSADFEWVPEHVADRYKELWDRWTLAMARRCDDAS